VGVHLLPPLLPLRTVAGDCLVDAVDILAHCVSCCLPKAWKVVSDCISRKHFNFLKVVSD
jgi:hypothetical protein